MLQKKHEQLQAQIRLLKAKEKTRGRKEDTRKKVLLGALLMDWMEKDPAIKKRVEMALPSWLTRDIDRKLFGLPVASSQK